MAFERKLFFFGVKESEQFTTSKLLSEFLLVLQSRNLSRFRRFLREMKMLMKSFMGLNDCWKYLRYAKISCPATFRTCHHQNECENNHRAGFNYIRDGWACFHRSRGRAKMRLQLKRQQCAEKINCKMIRMKLLTPQATPLNVTIATRQLNRIARMSKSRRRLNRRWVRNLKSHSFRRQLSEYRRVTIRFNRDYLRSHLWTLSLSCSSALNGWAWTKCFIVEESA